MLIIRCDRCGAQFDNPFIDAWTNTNPFAQAGSAGAQVRLPEGWKRILQKELCSACVRIVEQALVLKE